MSKAVGDEGNEVEVLSLLASQQTVDGIDNNLYNINVLPLVEATYIICLSHLSLMEDKVYGPCVVLNKQPVTDVLALAIYWQWLTMAYIVDE